MRARPSFVNFTGNGTRKKIKHDPRDEIFTRFEPLVRPAEKKGGERDARTTRFNQASSTWKCLSFNIVAVITVLKSTAFPPSVGNVNKRNSVSRKV